MTRQIQADFEEVVRAYYKDLYVFAYSLVNNEPDAVDLTQQAFYRYATHGHTIECPSKTKSWLLATLKNDFLDQVRRKKRFTHISIDSEEVELPRTEETCGESVDAKAVLAALQQLDEKFRLPLSLFYVEGLSYREIAVILEIPPGTVMSRLSRGKNHLANLLETPIPPSRPVAAHTDIA